MPPPSFPPLPPLSLALTGLPRGVPDSLRTHLDLASRLTYRSVTLDATLPTLRPRELDRSARRDLASLMRRRELTCAGLDLWIPPEHFTNPTEQDRALAAVLAAIELAADLARLSASAVVSTARASAPSSISICLPHAAPSDLIAQIDARAATCGVRIADHTFPPPQSPDHPAPRAAIGLGIDPAALLLANLDPAAIILRAPHPPRTTSASGSASTSTATSTLPLTLARLSDASTVARTAIGARDGRLDLLAYATALLAASYRSPVVVDVRGVLDPADAAKQAIDAWSNALPSM